MTTDHSAAVAIFAPDDFIVFLDETGDEVFRDKGNPVFGMGGVAVMGSELASLVERPWRDVRAAFRRSQDTPLHANEVERRLDTRKEDAIVRFFTDNAVGRLAVIAKHSTTYTGDLPADPVIQGMTMTLMKRIEDLARWIPAKRICMIFENNPRLVPKWEAAFSGLRFEEDGRELPFDLYVMPKGASPGLEAADFLMHIVAGHVRSGRDPQGKFAKRFDAAFLSAPSCLTSFCEVSDMQWWESPVRTRSD